LEPAELREFQAEIQFLIQRLQEEVDHLGQGLQVEMEELVQVVTLLILTVALAVMHRPAERLQIVAAAEEGVLHFPILMVEMGEMVIYLPEELEEQEKVMGVRADEEVLTLVMAKIPEAAGVEKVKMVLQVQALTGKLP
jgi:frataxin-like iron-binding protein CyaY